MCMHTFKTVHGCGCVIANTKPNTWCLLGDQCDKVNHYQISTKHLKKTCADCVKAQQQKKEEDEFLERDGFTVVARNPKPADTVVAPALPQRPALTHAQAVDLAERAAKSLNDLLLQKQIVGEKNRSLFEYILSLPRFLPRSRLVETWVWWAVGREPFGRLRSARDMAERQNFGQTFDASMDKAQKDLQEELDAMRANKKKH